MTWAKFYTYTPNATKAGTVDSANFAVPVVVTHLDLRSVANGGLVTENAGAGIPDITAFSNTGLTSAIPFHRVYWDPVAGTLWAWVKQANLSVAAGVPFYLGYGNAAVVADPHDPTNTWDASFGAIYLLSNGAVISLLDTKGVYTLTNNGAVAVSGTSPVGPSLSFNGTTQYLARTASTPATAYPLTLTTLFKPSGSVGTNQMLLSIEQSGSANLAWDVRARQTNAVRGGGGSAGITPQTVDGVLSSGAWSAASCSYASDTNRRLVVDGAAVISSAVSMGTLATPDNVAIGAAWSNSALAFQFSGLIGFACVSIVARSDSWNTAMTNALRNPATFAVESGPTAFSPGTTAFTTQPTTATSGVAMSSVVVTADAAASGLTCTLTLSGPNGSATGLTAVCNGSGVATFTPTVTGDGPGYSFTAAIPGYTGSTSNSFTTIGVEVAAAQALVTACGGDLALYSVNVPKIYGTGARAALEDVIGNAGGRAAGITYVQTTGAAKPVVSAGGTLDFDGVDDFMQPSAADARVNFSGSVPTPNPNFMIIGTIARSDGIIGGVAANPASTVTYPYAYTKLAGGKLQAVIATDGTAPSGFTTGIATADVELSPNTTDVRTITLGKAAFVNSSNVDGLYRFRVAGPQMANPGRMKTATAGSLIPFLGRFGAAFGNPQIAFVLHLSVEPTRAITAAIDTYAARFNAVTTTVETKTFLMVGDSLDVGTTNQPGGDTMTAVLGSGTTTIAYGMAHRVSGPGSLITQGYGVAGAVQKYNLGRSGGTLDDLINAHPYDVAVYADGYRSGRFDVVAMGISNSIQAGVNAANCLIKMAAYKTLCDAYGINLHWFTPPSKGAGANGSNANGTGYYLDNTYTGLSNYGIVAQTILAAMRASPLTYGAGIIDIEARAEFSITPLGASTACLSIIYYNYGNGVLDPVHFSPTGYALADLIGKTYFDGLGVVLPVLLNQYRQRAA